MIRSAVCLKTEEILLELVMADYTQLVRRASELVHPIALIQHSMRIGLQNTSMQIFQNLILLCIKAQDVPAKNILSTTELVGFAGWSSKRLIAKSRS